MASPSDPLPTSTPKLYGPDGVLLPLSESTRPPIDEENPVDTFLLRQREYPSRRLTARKIEEYTDLADNGEPELFLQLCEEIEEKEMRTGGALALRKAAIKSTDYTIMPIDDSPEAEMCADFVDANISEDLLRQEMTIILDSIFKPFACAWQKWGIVDSMQLPVEFSPIVRSIRWDWKKDEILLVTKAAPQGVPFSPWTTVRSVSPERFGHPARAGLARGIVWGYFLANYGLKDWASFVETFGKPFMIGRVPIGQLRNSEIVQKMLAGFRMLGASGRGIFDENSNVEFIEPKNLGSVQEKFVDHMERVIVQRILGHDLATISAPGNGQLGVTAAILVRADILQGDGTMLSEVIRRDTFVPMILFNLGEDFVRYAPRLSFLYERPIDKTALANVIKIIGDTFGENFQFSMQSIRDALDLPAPIDDADAITAAPAQVPGIPGGDLLPFKATASAHRGRGLISASRRGKIPWRALADQRRLDTLARRGERESVPSLAKLGEPIRAIVNQGIKSGASATTIAQEIAHVYPEMDAEKLRRVVEKAMIVAHLYGRIQGKG